MTPEQEQRVIDRFVKSVIPDLEELAREVLGDTVRERENIADMAEEDANALSTELPMASQTLLDFARKVRALNDDEEEEEVDSESVS